MSRARSLLHMVAAASVGTSVAHAQTEPCTPNHTTNGPDVIVGDVNGVSNYAAVGVMDAISLGTTSCNIGNVWLNWDQNTNQHPVVGQNLFKYKSFAFSAGSAVPYARFEQIGQSWLKNTFFALSESLCCTGCQTTNGTHLGIHCSDPYSSSRNGSQSGMEPKWQVNAHTGVFTYPPANPGFSGSVDRRTQYRLADCEASSATVRYYGECQYVTPDDAAVGNQNNNTSYIQATMSITGTFPNATASTVSTSGLTQRARLALQEWKVIDPSVTETEVPVTELAGGATGRVLLSSKATNLGNGFWHYEYAVCNQNSDVGIGGFSIPLPAGATVQNVGFRDVAYLNGDGILNVNVDGTDWPGVVSGSAITWLTQAFAANANGNSVRWGTTYNFRFDANVAPAASGNATLTGWKTGTNMLAAAQVPGTPTPAPCYANCDSSTIAPCLNVADFSCYLNKFAASDPAANCDNSTVAPILNVGDFSCFLNKFAAGCSSC